MKWLKSTTQKMWVISGKIIPACVTPHNDYLVLDDSTYSEIAKIPVIKGLLASGGILVLSEEPAEVKNSLDNLQVSLASLKAQNTELQEQLAYAQKMAKSKSSAKSEIEAIKNEAIAEIQAKQDALDAANAEIETLKAQLASIPTKPEE